MLHYDRLISLNLPSLAVVQYNDPFDYQLTIVTLLSGSILFLSEDYK